MIKTLKELDKVLDEKNLSCTIEAGWLQDVYLIKDEDGEYRVSGLGKDGDTTYTAIEAAVVGFISVVTHLV